MRLISKHWQHHSDHSGYDRIVPLLGTALTLLNASNIWHTWMPGRIAVRLAEHAGVEDYNYVSFFDEWSALRDMLRARKPTIYHFLYGDESYRYLARMYLGRRHKVVATYHWPPEILTSGLSCVHHLRRLDGLVVVSKNQIPYFEPLIDRERIFWVPHGVDTEIFSPGEYDTYNKKSRRVCLFVGVHQRDFKTLHQVIEIVRKHSKDVQFTLVTFETEFPRFLGLEGVNLRHNVPEADLVELYRNANVLLQPMLDSTANNAILEGMSCGLPVIATDVGGIRDYVDTNCSILTPLGDADAMAIAVLNVLSEDSTQRAMGLAARNLALEFDWHRVAESMQRVYAQIVS